MTKKEIHDLIDVDLIRRVLAQELLEGDAYEEIELSLNLDPHNERDLDICEYVYSHIVQTYTLEVVG